MNSSDALPRRRGRPPGTGTQHLDTRQALVRYGTEVLTEQGFGSTGIDQILKHLNIPKGSFYHYFPSKEAFGLAVIDNYASYFGNKLARWLTDASLTPLARLAGFVDDARQGIIRHDFRRGCVIGNLSQEFGSTHQAFTTRLEHTFNDWERQLSACLDEAKQIGEIAKTADTGQLASFFWIGWEGAVMRAKLTRSDAPLQLFSHMFFSNLPR